MGVASGAEAGGGALAAARETGDKVLWNHLWSALRTRVRELVSATRPGAPRGGVDSVVAVAGTAATVVGFAADGGTRVTGAEISRAIERLLPDSGSGRRQRPDPGWKDLKLAGAVFLEAILDRLGPTTVEAVDIRLADGVIGGLARRSTSEENPRRHSGDY